MHCFCFLCNVVKRSFIWTIFNKISLYLRKLVKRDIILFISVESLNRSSVTEQHVIIKFQNDCLWVCIIFLIQQIITDIIFKDY